MGSLYSAEKQTWAILRSLLKVLSSGASMTYEKLFKSIEEDLSPREFRVLMSRGGIKEVKRLAYYSRRRGFTNKTGYGDGSEYSVTTTGMSKLEDLNFKLIDLSNQSWDGKWRILSFDVAEDNRTARDAVRRLIKQLGFKQLHRSVWITPFRCEQHVKQIKEAHKIKEDIILLTVDKFEGEEAFASKFGLSR